MTPKPDAPFRFDYAPGPIRYGTGAAGELAEEGAAHGVERALVVTGETVGQTEAVMDPIRAGLGDRFAGLFAETTPEKRLSTAIDAARAMADADADGLVAVGGGSSLDVATVARVVAASDRPAQALQAELRERGTLTMPDAAVPPMVAVPTTLAGAELSQGAGITAAPASTDRDGDNHGEDAVSGGVSDPRLLPTAVVADPELYATTPASVLTGSAMNGFDKGIEALYAAAATPITDATAVRGLQLLREGLPAMAADSTDRSAMETVVRGTLLVQYGISRPDATLLSVIHAFGHGLRDFAGVQQGVAHAIVAPHALAYVFDHVDGRRERLADGLGVATDGLDDHAIAAAVVDAVAEVRDSLGLPDALAAIDGISESDLDAVAELVLADGFWANAPPGLDPTAEELEGVLRRAWAR